MRIQRFEKRRFRGKITKFNSRFDLRFFLLNTLSQILYNRWWHCVCGEICGGQEEK